MFSTIIEECLKFYDIKTQDDEENSLKEILQEIILYGLSSANFFKDAIFYGGTSLRILYDLPRFSEDLDFMLHRPNPKFKWEPYLESIKKTCVEFGIEPEILDKTKAGNTIQKIFLKDNSIGKLLNLRFPMYPGKKIRIKLEIDTNPPEGTNKDLKYLSFPLDYSVITQDLSNNFSGKCHALLCREYIKGRDWYDFTWHVNRKVCPNFEFLSNAIEQQGPWSGKKIKIDTKWLIAAFKEKIFTMDWQAARQDVLPFVKVIEKKSIHLWGVDFFLDKLKKLNATLKASEADKSSS